MGSGSQYDLCSGQDRYQVACEGVAFRAQNHSHIPFFIESLPEPCDFTGCPAKAVLLEYKNFVNVRVMLDSIRTIAPDDKADVRSGKAVAQGKKGGSGKQEIAQLVVGADNQKPLHFFQGSFFRFPCGTCKSFFQVPKSLLLGKLIESVPQTQ